MKFKIIDNANSNSRSAFATLLVLVAILALSLTVYSFANQAFLEHAATRASIRQTQSRLTALDGIELTRSRLVSTSRIDRNQVIHPSSSNSFAKQDTESQFEEFQSTIYQKVVRASSKSKGESQRGLASESAKLNIHSLDLRKRAESLSRARLCTLPNMTPQRADALLDWIDADDEPRSFGAESAWYSENAPQHRPSNGPIQDWTQLLFVRGFNEQLLFGEDTNLNGWLDWNENDGDGRLPIDNHDNILNEGLAAFLSLDAYEWNLNTLGKPKIDLNDDNLHRLFANVQNRFGEEAATFIAAFRIDGPKRKDKAFDPITAKQVLESTIEERLEIQLTPSNKSQSGSQSGSSSSVSRQSIGKGGLSLDRTPIHRIASVVDLIDASVIALIETEEKILTSPWKLGGSDNNRMILELEDAFTTAPGERLYGRIDITQAAPEVLLTIPGFSRAMVESVVALRKRAMDHGGNASIQSVLWLIENQIVDLEFLRSIAPFITTDGAIYSGYSAGHDSVSQSAAIIKFTLGREGTFVRLLEYREVGMVPWIR